MPRLTDDGRTVTLDLHGATVAEAERLTRAAAREAARRGRATLRIVHGHSTTDRWGEARTIKTMLHALLDDRALAPHVAQSVRAEGHVLLGLAPAPRTVPARLTLADLR